MRMFLKKCIHFLKKVFQKIVASFSGASSAAESSDIETESSGIRYIVVDLEWNQYPKWIKTPVSNSGVVMPHEIIQIGAIKVDEEFNPIDAFSVGIRLPGHRKLSKHVARVIQKTQTDIDQGYDFSVAYAFFQDWIGDASSFITWGKDDFRVLDNNLAYYNLQSLTPSQWYDAQLIYARQIRGDSAQVSLANAAAAVGVRDEDLMHHDALNDAYITVGVCSCLDMQKGMAEHTELSLHPHPFSQKSENRLFQQKKFVSASSDGGFESRALAKKHCETQKLLCPVCGNVMKLESSRIVNGDRWMRMAGCNAHGKHLVRYRVRHRSDGAFFWSQAIYAPNQELEQYYREKLMQREKKRKAAGSHPAPTAKQKEGVSKAASSV